MKTCDGRIIQEAPINSGVSFDLIEVAERLQDLDFTEMIADLVDLDARSRFRRVDQEGLAEIRQLARAAETDLVEYFDACFLYGARVALDHTPSHIAAAA